MQLTVSEEFNMRIDRWLSEHDDTLSRSYIQRMIDEERVVVIPADRADMHQEVCGTAVKSSYKVREGDIIRYEIPESVIPDILPEDIPLDIVYEDDDVILINKPKGMVVHPAAGHFTGTMVNALMYHCRDNLSGINGVMRPGIVHRIDRDTTGIVIACKNDSAHLSLSEQLSSHTINRRYRAIVHDVIKDDEGVIEGAIARHPADRKKMAIDNARGRRAVTHYRVLERFRNYTYVECRLETGRTHQIRVHMASVKHPVLGDQVYGPARCPYKLEGQTLHAMTLGFIHPSTGEYMEFSAALPDYFQALLEKLPK